MWSFGICLIEMYTHNLPYVKQTSKEEEEESFFNYFEVANGSLSPLMHLPIVKEKKLYTLMHACLSFSHSFRVHPKQIVFALLELIIEDEEDDDEEGDGKQNDEIKKSPKPLRKSDPFSAMKKKMEESEEVLSPLKVRQK